MTFSVTIATDGSCIQSGEYRSGVNEMPRPGAWGFVARLADGQIVKRAIPFADTTIGAMEVAALLNALEYVAVDIEGTVLIQCDSQYVVNGYNEWIAGWAAKNFTKKGGLAHAVAWRRIHELKTSLGARVTVEWVKAHSNSGSLNDLVDALANGCARDQIPVGLDIRSETKAPVGTGSESAAGEAHREAHILQRTLAFLLTLHGDEPLARAREIRELLDRRQAEVPA